MCHSSLFTSSSFLLASIITLLSILALPPQSCHALSSSSSAEAFTFHRLDNGVPAVLSLSDEGRIVEQSLGSRYACHSMQGFKCSLTNGLTSTPPANILDELLQQILSQTVKARATTADIITKSKLKNSKINLAETTSTTTTTTKPTAPPSATEAPAVRNLKAKVVEEHAPTPSATDDLDELDSEVSSLLEAAKSGKHTGSGATNGLSSDSTAGSIIRDMDPAERQALLSQFAKLDQRGGGAAAAGGAGGANARTGGPATGEADVLHHDSQQQYQTQDGNSLVDSLLSGMGLGNDDDFLGGDAEMYEEEVYFMDEHGNQIGQKMTMEELRQLLAQTGNENAPQLVEELEQEKEKKTVPT